MQNELSRHRAIDGTATFDPSTQDIIDRLITLVAKALNCPVAVLSFIDCDEIHIKSHFGPDTALLWSTLSSSCVDPSEPGVVVRDLSASASSVAPSHGTAYRTYAHASVCTPEGGVVGAVSVLSLKARKFTKRDLDILADSAATISAELNRNSTAQPDAAVFGSHDIVTGKPAIERTAPNLLVGLHTIDGACEYISPSCVALTGYSPAQLKTVDLCSLVHPEDVERVRRETCGQAMKGRAAVVTYRARRKDGMYRWLETLSTPLRDPDGDVSKFLTSTQDVTPRKLVEQRLIESQQRFRSLFDYSLDPVFCLDLQSRFETANHAFEKLFGYPAGELHTQLFLPFVDPSDRPMAETIFEMTTHGEPLTFELTMLSRDGRQVPTSGLSVPIVIADKVVGVYFIVRDRTIQKRTDALLREESEVLALIATGVPLTEVLVEVARTVEALCDGATTAIMLLDRDAPLFRCIAGPSFPVDLRETLDHVPLDSRLGSFGVAVFRNERVTTDIASDPAWEPFREIAGESGFRSCWSAPIGSARNNALGTLDIYFKKPRAVRPDDVQLISRAGAPGTNCHRA